MPIDQTEECDNCGTSVDTHAEKCHKCGMYKGEDPEEFQRHVDSLIFEE